MSDPSVLQPFPFLTEAQRRAFVECPPPANTADLATVISMLLPQCDYQVLRGLLQIVRVYLSLGEGWTPPPLP